MDWKRSLGAAVVAGVLGVSQGAAAEQFPLLELPPGFRDKIAERERQALPERDRERIVREASAALTAASHFNRPGASWEDYLRDWYNCKQTTNGSRIPGGKVTYVYSPSMLSPRQSGIGAVIGGAIGQGENRDALHEANRDACLQGRGWRRVTLDAVEVQRVEGLSDGAYVEWMGRQIGSENPAGDVERNGHASLPENPAINPDAPPPGEPTLHLQGGGAGSAQVALQPGEGALVLAFRRPDSGSKGQAATIVLRRYDLDNADLATPMPGQDEQKLSVVIENADRRAGYELQIVPLPAGHYVIDGTAVDGNRPAKSNCFGAPLIEIPAGSAVYGGDWIPYHGVKLGKGKVLPDALMLFSDLERAKSALARFQPELAEQLTPMAVANGASYSCTDPDIVLDRWALANVAERTAKE